MAQYRLPRKKTYFSLGQSNSWSDDPVNRTALFTKSPKTTKTILNSKYHQNKSTGIPFHWEKMLLFQRLKSLVVLQIIWNQSYKRHPPILSFACKDEHQKNKPVKINKLSRTKEFWQAHCMNMRTAYHLRRSLPCFTFNRGIMAFSPCLQIEGKAWNKH